jgi:demethylmenaquinone methyltransferase/2-methoxy-6-polyprenyl-1,4-benzoquinol methylase
MSLTLESAVADKPVVPQALKRPFVQKLFTSIAPRYDWFNRLATCGLDQYWRRQAVRHADVRPGHLVLDVCAGTGDLAILCSRRQHGRGSTVGIDLNQEMLLHAAKKQQAKRLRISWLQAEAETLPFPTGTFDRVVIGFSTRNLTSLGAGLAEMMRVLRPGGILVVLETGRPSNPLLRAGYQAFLFTYARAVGWALTGRMWPFTYLARSVQAFLTPDQFVQELRRAEADARYVPLSRGLASLFIATKPAPRAA